MKLRELAKLIDAKFITTDLGQDFECTRACSSDLMSDVLAFSEEKSILLTGLSNIQVIRTAEMMDIKVVIFVRGKMPCKKLIDYAQSKDIIILGTTMPLFESSGILYSNGLGCGIKR